MTAFCLWVWTKHAICSFIKRVKTSSDPPTIGSNICIHHHPSVSVGAEPNWCVTRNRCGDIAPQRIIQITVNIYGQKILLVVSFTWTIIFFAFYLLYSVNLLALLSDLHRQMEVEGGRRFFGEIHNSYLCRCRFPTTFLAYFLHGNPLNWTIWTH